MNKYSSYSTIEDLIDLHDVNGRGNPISEQDVWNVLDNFILTMEHKYSMKLKKGFAVKIGIIVGKGVRSKLDKWQKSASCLYRRISQPL